MHSLDGHRGVSPCGCQDRLLGNAGLPQNALEYTLDNDTLSRGSYPAGGVLHAFYQRGCKLAARGLKLAP